MRLGFLTLLWVLLNNIEYFGKDTISTVLTIVSFSIIALDVYIIVRNFRKGVYLKKFNTTIRKLSWLVKMTGVCILLFTLIPQYLTEDAIKVDLNFKNVIVNQEEFGEEAANGLGFMQKHSYILPKCMKGTMIVSLGVMNDVLHAFHGVDVNAITEEEEAVITTQLESMIPNCAAELRTYEAELGVLENTMYIVIALYGVSVVLFYFEDLRDIRKRKKQDVGFAEV